MFRLSFIFRGLSVILFLIVGFMADAQPITLQRKTKTDISSQARSVFTRFKDRFFSNYKYFDELKNTEINLDVYSGYSMSFGRPLLLYGFDYGGNILLDYYFKEGVALRTGIGVRGNHLYRSAKLDIFNVEGALIDSNGQQKINVNLSQLLIPIQFVFTKYRYNTGFWYAFGIDLGITLNGRFQLQNITSLPELNAQYAINNRNDKFFANDTSNNNAIPAQINANNGNVPRNNKGSTYFNRIALYGNVALGYKFSRFINAYAKIQVVFRPLQNTNYPASVSNHAINFGMLLSLWQY